MVDGLRIIPDFVTMEEEADLVRTIGLSDVIVPGTERNRVLRYGPGVAETGYTSGRVIAKIPYFIDRLSDRLIAEGLISERPDAVSVNEYQAGQGIDLHTDSELAGDVISTIGIAGDATLRLWKGIGVGLDLDVPFPRRTLVQFTGEVRWRPWKHGILPVTSPRLSIVFRRATSAAPILGR